MKRRFACLVAVLTVLAIGHEADAREVTSFNEGWKFALGNAADLRADFNNGTEYFTYLTKTGLAADGPYALKFGQQHRPGPGQQKESQQWTDVNLPHDWVLQLPYSAAASHSHGYKEVGYKYPAQSVGWYRKFFTIPADAEGRHFQIRFDGIFRNAQVWCNGFWMGQEPSGYATQVYEITDYLNYGGENLICVRVDASIEEGWFYEGAGIYRNVWLIESDKVHVPESGTYVWASVLEAPYSSAELTVETQVENASLSTAVCNVRQTLIDADGKAVAKADAKPLELAARESGKTVQKLNVTNPNLWDTESPYLYTVRTEILVGGNVIDVYDTRIGIRDICFDADEGFFLNGRQLELKGVNMHQDEAGVGAAIPDALQRYRIERLKSFGCNAYRSSHNPCSPAMLDVCDEMGILVIDENRLMGSNAEHRRLLESMIKRDRNHPCVILWSVGNEEWGIESNQFGVRIASTMTEIAHRLDPTRPTTYGNSGGREPNKGVDVAGYNYIKQNAPEEQRLQYPERKLVGTEETTGCGTRSIYFDDRKNGRMAALNRTDTTYENVIERGWKFYAGNPWAAGLFYWTGFDYKGEPNPLSYPAVSSEFGLLDYCGFYKDEAWYLKSWWTDETVLHILPHWNLEGHEGEEVQVWAYSNCDEVQLWVNGKNLGRKQMPQNGHLSWTAVYQPGSLKAVGWKNGRKVAQEVVKTAGPAAKMVLTANRSSISADGSDVSVINIELRDAKGNFTPTAAVDIKLRLEGDAHILGVGNGDPAFQGAEHPQSLDCKEFSIVSFGGLAQVLVQSGHTAGTSTLSCSADGIGNASISIETK